MLSSKKSTLISCLLKRITSDAFCDFRPTPSSATDDHRATCNRSKSLAGLLWSNLSRCLQSAEEECPNNIQRPLLQATTRLLQSLSTCELRRLWEAIQSWGRHEGECVLVPRSTRTYSSRRRRESCDEQSTDQCAMHQQQHQQCEDQIDPRLLAILQWRWPSIPLDHQNLQPLPCCHHYILGHSLRDSTIQQNHSVCINPYHWGLLITPDCSLEDVTGGQLNGLINHNNNNNHQYYPMPSSTPPPSYKEQQPSTCMLPGPPHVRNHKWCRLAYWEYRERVGNSFPVSNNSVNVSAESTDEDSICLLSLFDSRIHGAPQEVKKCLTKIGNGVSIFRDSKNCVWLYNRSRSTIFVSSRTIDPNAFVSSSSGASACSIMRVPPGHIIKAYDLQVAHRLQFLFDPNTHTSGSNNNAHNALENHTFSFSFVKGFGPGFHRRDILQCPCWLEVFLDLVPRPRDH